MSVRLTPRGTRGSGFGNLPRWARPIVAFGSASMYRVSRGRMRVAGRPLLLLTTTGAKTGRRRSTTLGWFPDDDGPADARLVVASAGGAAAHPARCATQARRPEGTPIHAHVPQRR